MVQRKLPKKLTLQPQNLFLSHDIKSPRGADLKAKKMKKSGSIKRPKQPGTSPPALPNYMKSTTSSDARKESKPKLGSSSGKKAMARTLRKNPSFKPARASVVRPVFMCENVDAKRATCSSTLKDCKFPAYLKLRAGGTESVGNSAIKVCPYTYCSLNGHHHAPLPPLKCFLSARRRAVKTQRSVKDDELKRSSSSVVEDQSKDFFVEIYTDDGAGVDQTVVEDQEEQVFYELEEEIMLSGTPPNDHFYEQDSDGSDMEWETAYCLPLQLDYDYECSPKIEVEPDPEAADASDNRVIKDEFTVSSDYYFDENFVVDVSQESLDEEGLSFDEFSSSDDDMQSLSSSASLQLLVEEIEGVCGEEEKCKTATHPQTGDQASSDILNHEGEEVVAVTGDDHAEAANCIFNKANIQNTAESETKELQFTANSKKLVQDGDDVGAFNPRAPNFLPLEPDPEAQKVDLKHQDLDERKNAEEWMVDYALRQVVTKLGPARKRKVSLLVEAFEKVMPANKWDLQLRHASAFDQARPIQACR